MKLKFPVFDGLPHLGFELQLTRSVFVHRPVKNSILRFAARFGAIHSDVGIAHHIFGAFVSGVTECNADAGRDENFVAA